MIVDETQAEEKVDPSTPTAADPYPSVFSRARAGWQKSTVEADLWAYSARVEDEVLDEVFNRLPVESQDRITADRRIGRDPARRQELILAEAADLDDGSPQWAGVPLTAEAFSREVNERRRAAWEEAGAVLEHSGGGLAGFVGSTGAFIADPLNIALTAVTAPLGGWGGAAGTAGRMTLGRMLLMEATINAGAEAMTLPSEFRVAEELGLPDPNPVERIATGAAFGAALPGAVVAVGAGLKGAKRFADYYFGRQLEERARIGDKGDPMGHQAAVSEAEYELETGWQTPIQATDDERYRLALTLQAEAGGEGFEGMVAAGAVIANRVRVGGYGKGLYGVIMKPGQFSAWNGVTGYAGGAGAINMNALRPSEAAIRAADLIISGKYVDPTGGATHYYNPAAANPAWGQRSGGQWMRIGNHVFGMADAGRDGYTAPGSFATNLRMIGGVRSDGNYWQGLDGMGAAHASNPNYRDYSQLAREYTFEAKQGYVPVGDRDGRTVYAAPDYVRDADGNYLSVSAADAERMAAENGWLIPTRAEYKALAQKATKVTMPTQKIGEKGGAGDSVAYSRAVAEAMVDIAPGTPVIHGKEFFQADTASRPAQYTEPSAFTGYTATSRGYTQTGEVVVGDDLRLEVDYEVVDISDLRQARGDLQPRDRSRSASDDWVAATAARLDPALLMPSPTADRGAPLVGPDNVIESGNGRTLAIGRAYDEGLDRAAAYRQQIEAAGYTIPEGVERPVLIARRKTELDTEARRRMVIDAQDSGVARMTATERAQVGTRALTPEVLAKFDPTKKLTDPANRDFARAFAGYYPKAERGAFIAGDKGLSIDGIRQIKDSLFSRAWAAPDIVAKAVEAQPGELKTILDALDAAAPDIALLRADIAAGAVRPEMDISPFVLEAVRLIVTARELAASGQGRAAELLEELLADHDLLAGAWSPLTQALVAKFMPNGRAARAQDIAEFLSAYAREARVAGRGGDMLGEVGPLDVLKAVDRKAFGDLEATGRVREPLPEDVPPEPELNPEAIPADAYEDGARSPEAEAADQLLEDELRSGMATPAEPDPAQVARAAFEAEGIDLDAITYTQPDGTTLTARDMLDDLDADRALEEAINVCLIGGSNG